MQAKEQEMAKRQKKVAISETVANSEKSPGSYADSVTFSEARSQILKNFAISDKHAIGEIS
jgi:hypothetical protein